MNMSFIASREVTKICISFVAVKQTSNHTKSLLGWCVKFKRTDLSYISGEWNFENSVQFNIVIFQNILEASFTTI